MQEIWKDIFDFEGIYKISSFGRLKSFKRCPNGRILSNKNKVIENNGRKQTLSQWARESGVNKGTLLYRLNSGWATQKAIATHVEHRFDSVTFQGKTQSLSRWAKELNINHTTLNMRLGKYGWTVEKALTTPVRRCI